MKNKGIKACLEAVTIQLFDSNVHFSSVVVNDPTVNAPKPSLADQQGPAEPAAGRFELREGEDPQIIGPTLTQQLEEGRRVGNVAGVGVVELGAAVVVVGVVVAAGGDAEGARPGDLGGGAGNDSGGVVVVAAPLAVGEMEALHLPKWFCGENERERESRMRNCGGIKS